jgi:hypothetical protein
MQFPNSGKEILLKSINNAPEFLKNFYLRSEGVVGLHNHKHVIYEKIQMRKLDPAEKVVKIIMLNFILQK